MKNTISVPAPSGRFTVTATSHAGEVLQGAIHDGTRTRRVLLSLPAPTLRTVAEVLPTPGRRLSIEPRWMTKAHRAALLLLRAIHETEPEIRVRLTSNIPTGKGCGSSTTDAVATMRALLRYFNISMTEERLAQFVVAAEEATDGSVLSQSTIFRHREGVVHDYLDAAFPSMNVLVVDTEPGRTINTVSMTRARYSLLELQTFESLIERAKRAFRMHDAAELGQIATESARISQRFLPKPHLEALLELTRAGDGYGIAVSHSGTIASLLLPIHLPHERKQRIIVSAERLGMSCITEFSLGSTHAKQAAA